MTPRIERGGQRPADVERLLAELPEWFGLPDSNANPVPHPREAARVARREVTREAISDTLVAQLP